MSEKTKWAELGSRCKEVRVILALLARDYRDILPARLVTTLFRSHQDFANLMIQLEREMFQQGIQDAEIFF